MAQLSEGELHAVETLSALLPETLVELVRVYREHHAECLECGEQRHEHTQSRSCEGFRTIRAVASLGVVETPRRRS